MPDTVLGAESTLIKKTSQSASCLNHRKLLLMYMRNEQIPVMVQVNNYMCSTVMIR